MNRIIISKEEEREDPRRDSSIYLRVQWCFHIPTRITKIFEYSVFYSVLHAIQQLQVILHTELILLQELQGSSRADQYKASPATVPRVSKHSTRQNKAPKAIQHKQASSNSTRQKQHSRRQAASTQSLQQFPGQVLHYRILPEFIPKGLSIVCPCNTKVSVFQFTYSCLRIILQEN